MMTQIATVVYTLGIVGLFWLDRDSKLQPSKALWLPVIWLLIVGSRPVSVWLNLAPSNPRDVILEGSPIDAFLFTALVATGVLVLFGRRKRVGSVLRTNWPIMLYFGFCLVSVLWSDFPDVAAKRWTKAIGDLVMALIVVTDVRPTAALTRFLSRTGFVLLPLSVLFIKYYDHFGRAYDAFGMAVNVGVTTNKNSLGVVTLVLSLGALWRVLVLLRDKGQADRRRHLLAQGALLLIGVYLLTLAHSATSGVCFVLGAGLMVAATLPVMRRRPAALHTLVLVILVGASLVVLFGGNAAVAHAVGRQSDLTGRTAIWDAVIPLAPNPLVGAGFESFWLGPRLEKMWRLFPVFLPNEAHNGYIETYLNLGWVGLILIALVLISGYRRITKLLRNDPALCGLMVGYVAAAAVYSVTEVGFRLLNPMWLFLLLAIVAPGGKWFGVSDSLREQPVRRYAPVGFRSKARVYPNLPETPPRPVVSLGGRN